MDSPGLVDTHAHLMDAAYAPDLAEVLDRARGVGVRAFVVVGYDLESSEAAIALASRHPDVWATVGIHPNRADVATDAALARIERMAGAPRVVAIGECGLDFYRDRTTPDEQRGAFRAQLAIAAAVSRPIVVHSREAMAETLQLLTEAAPAHGGVMHCFDGTAADASAAVAAGLCISVAGPITYRKDPTLAEAIASVPLSRLLIETDCPYLGPIGFRGQRNEPSRVALVAEAVARVRGATLEQIGAATTKTACTLFGIEAARA
jgi:TatD DNase family protein